ncbi:MAG TPA: TIGR04086 family membrane protein [Clostridiales bacterium]|nr:TIGR04086 family membrane protein [Clostridiales bacterium]
MSFFKSDKQSICILRGIFISFLFTLCMLIIYSVLLVYTNLSEQTIRPVIITITGVSILIGSSLGTRKLHKNGMISGGIIGASYILLLYLISSIVSSNFSINWVSVIMIIVGLIGGVFGGIVGVNTG